MRVTAKVQLATEAALRSAAARLFARKGVEGTSTREIAQDAGVASGTLFNYFASKEALAVTVAAVAFESGRTQARERLSARRGSLEEDLFTLWAADLRALAPLRSFVAEVLDAGFSPFAGEGSLPEATAIRTARLEDAAVVLAHHGLADAATAPVMHLCWALYLGVLSFWAADGSPNQEDSLALLDRTVRMFTGALKPAPAQPPIDAGPTGAAEVSP